MLFCGEKQYLEQPVASFFLRQKQGIMAYVSACSAVGTKRKSGY